MFDLTRLTDDELLDEYDSARGTMSYYNAAEGNWSKETEARNKAREFLNRVAEELKKRNLEGRPGNYLC